MHRERTLILSKKLIKLALKASMSLRSTRAGLLALMPASGSVRLSLWKDWATVREV